eukprot:TRINITY_DN17226_c0_g1_i1.p1 TRINITY_DN17226_c0_g1~~TRINITY_DN17226_c0_g1_i1.p1  ORF type:complete len:226 (-),score=49.21 TRINITY_DN17226_c0_g1_i1:167-844(-)
MEQRLAGLSMSEQIKGIGRECEASMSELSLRPMTSAGLSSLDIIRGISGTLDGVSDDLDGRMQRLRSPANDRQRLCSTAPALHTPHAVSSAVDGELTLSVDMHSLIATVSGGDAHTVSGLELFVHGQRVRVMAEQHTPQHTQAQSRRVSRQATAPAAREQSAAHEHTTQHRGGQSRIVEQAITLLMASDDDEGSGAAPQARSWGSGEWHGRRPDRDELSDGDSPY